MKKSLLLLLFAFVGLSINAQTAEELKKEQAPKKMEIEKLQGEVNSLQDKIDALTGWKKGAFGTIGASLSGFSNWYSRTAPNASAGNIGVLINAYANLIEDTYFWRNSGTINLGWVKLDDESVFEDEKGEAETLAGFVLEISKSFPKVNSEIAFKTYTFTIEALNNKRIKQLKVTLKK